MRTAKDLLALVESSSSGVELYADLFVVNLEYNFSYNADTRAYRYKLTESKPVSSEKRRTIPTIVNVLYPFTKSKDWQDCPTVGSKLSSGTFQYQIAGAIFEPIWKQFDLSRYAVDVRENVLYIFKKGSRYHDAFASLYIDRNLELTVSFEQPIRVRRSAGNYTFKSDEYYQVFLPALRHGISEFMKKVSDQLKKDGFELSGNTLGYARGKSKVISRKTGVRKGRAV